MADMNNGNIPQQGAGSFSNDSDAPQLDQQGAGNQQAGSSQVYLTKDEALQLFDSLFDRKAQSITDKTAARVQRVLSAAQQNGVQLSTQQAKSLVEEFEAIQRQEQNPGQPAQRQPAQAQAQPSGQPESLHPVLLTAQTMMEEAGITIDDGDPELALIDQQTASAKRFLDSVEQAIEAKRQRLAQNLPARMPIVAGGKGPGGGGKAALTAELSALIEAPGPKNMVRIKEIKAQLAQYK